MFDCSRSDKITGVLMSKIILLFLSIFLISINSNAEFNSANCNVNILTSANLNEETRQHFNQPFDQHSTQLCYSYAAADMLSFRAQRSISPLYLAQAISQQQGNEFDAFNAGEIINGVLLVNDGTRLCTNAGYNSRITNENLLITPRPLNCAGANQLVRFSNPIKLSMYRDCLSDQTPRHTLDDAFKNRVLTDINAELDAGRIVGISVNINQLSPVKPGHDRVNRTAAHAMTIIGRKWVNNRCEYVFRNSYGNDGCGNGIFDNSRVNCTSPTGFPSGTISISEPVFKEAMHRAVIIKNNQTANASDEDEFEAITPSFCRPNSSAASSSAAPVTPTATSNTNNPVPQDTAASPSPTQSEQATDNNKTPTNTNNNDNADAKNSTPEDSSETNTNNDEDSEE